MSLPTRFIICTKWAVLDSEATEAAVAAYQALPSEIKDTAKAPDTLFKLFWTPIGTPHLYTKKSSIRGVPVSYDTEDNAIAGLKEIVNKQPNLSRQELKFSVLEVRYVPNKIKTYKQDWHTKYVVKETELELKDHKFIDTIK